MKNPQLIIASSLLPITAVTLLNSTYQIKTGEVGVISRFGKVVRVTEPGLGFKTPFITNVKKVDVKAQVYDPEPMSSGVKGKQSVLINTSIDYVISDPSRFVSNYTEESVESNIRRILNESVKTETLNYTLDEAIGDSRGQLSTVIKDTFVEKIQQNDLPIKVSNITVEDITPPAEIAEAIKRTTIAVQDAKTAEQLKAKAENEAQSKVITAKGEAESNAVLAKSLKMDGELVIKMKQLEVQAAAVAKWNGVLPTTNTGDAIPFLQVK